MADDITLHPVELSIQEIGILASQMRKLVSDAHEVAAFLGNNGPDDFLMPGLDRLEERSRILASLRDELIRAGRK